MEDVGRQLARTLGDLAVEMQAQQGSSDTLQAIVEGAAHIVPGARWAGISMIQGREVVAKVPTDPVVAKLEDLQTEVGEGPCLTALRDHHTVHIPDMSTETRWPEFCRQAVELGVHSLLSLQLFVRSENLGALNLYAVEPGVFTADSIDIGTIIAQHAAIAMIGENTRTQFDRALASRDVIGQAKGILMNRENLTGVQAFALLTRTSQETNMKLVEIAEWLVDYHEDSVGGQRGEIADSPPHSGRTGSDTHS